MLIAYVAQDVNTITRSSLMCSGASFAILQCDACRVRVIQTLEVVQIARLGGLTERGREKRGAGKSWSG